MKIPDISIPDVLKRRVEARSRIACEIQLAARSDGASFNKFRQFPRRGILTSRCSRGDLRGKRCHFIPRLLNVIRTGSSEGRSANRFRRANTSSSRKIFSGRSRFIQEPLSHMRQNAQFGIHLILAALMCTLGEAGIISQ